MVVVISRAHSTVRFIHTPHSGNHARILRSTPVLHEFLDASEELKVP
jgi:hypothetical protein